VNVFYLMGQVRMEFWHWHYGPWYFNQGVCYAHCFSLVYRYSSFCKKI